MNEEDGEGAGKEDEDFDDHNDDVQPATLLLLPLKEFSMPRNKISITIDHLDRPTYDH